MVSSSLAIQAITMAMAVQQTAALPATPSDTDTHAYMSMPDASRSPCPALNVLANHGYLPRDGKSITMDDFNTAVSQVYNVDPSFAASFSSGIFGALSKKNNVTSLASVDLADLDAHGFTEHDASLTRFDAIQGDNHSVQPTLLTALLADADADGNMTPASFAAARVRRQNESAAAGSPPFPQFLQPVVYTEASLTLHVLGGMAQDPATGELKIPVAAVQQFFGDERLPDGWVKPSAPVTGDAVSKLASQMYGSPLFGSR